MEYHKTILSYIDFLGLKNLIHENKKPEKIYKKLNDFIKPLIGYLPIDLEYENDTIDNLQEKGRGTLQTFIKDIDEKTDTYFFSDTVIRVTDIESINDKYICKALEHEIEYLIYALLELLGSDLLARGVITIGENYHSKKVIFGPALIKANLLEGKEIIYPRICIDNKLSDEIFLKDNSIYSNKRILSTMLTQDFDGMFFVDYLKFSCVHWLYFLEHGKFSQYSPRSSFRTIDKKYLEHILTNSKMTIESRLSNIKEEYATKIFWLKNYHNRTLLKHGKDIDKTGLINFNDYLIE
jgi:hypothetical protein